MAEQLAMRAQERVLLVEQSFNETDEDGGHANLGHEQLDKTVRHTVESFFHI